LSEIRNPNLQTPGSGGGSGSGGDMRSTIAFTLLMLLVVLGFQYFKPKQATPAPAAQTQSQMPQPAGPAAAGQQAQPQLAAGSVQASSATPAVAAALETDTTIENQQYKIVFTNRGAQVKHWILKKYNDTAGKPLDMVQPQAAASFGFPLSFYTYEPALTAQLNQALYQVTASGAQPSATGSALAPETNALTFHYAANGLDVVKTVRFDSSYVITVEAEVKRNGAPVRALISWPAGLGDMEEFLPSSLTRSQTRTSTLSQFAWSLDGKQDSQGVAKVSNNATFDQPYAYAAITDLYFVSAFMPDARARFRGHAAQHHRRAQRPERPQQPEEAGPSAWTGHGRHQRRYSSAPLRRPQVDGRAEFNPRHWRGRQAHRAVA
jgi:YidC/Oxa1 family membrane protein insertase